MTQLGSDRRFQDGCGVFRLRCHGRTPRRWHRVRSGRRTPYLASHPSVVPMLLLQLWSFVPRYLTERGAELRRSRFYGGAAPYNLDDFTDLVGGCIWDL